MNSHQLELNLLPMAMVSLQKYEAGGDGLPGSIVTMIKEIDGQAPAIQPVPHPGQNLVRPAANGPAAFLSLSSKTRARYAAAPGANRNQHRLGHHYRV